MPEQYPSSPSSHPVVVLIIEDDPLVRTYHAALVTASGYQPRTAANGDEALVLLQEGLTPSLIMLDLEMPEMNGRAFRRRQLSDERLARIPVLVCSGYEAPVSDPLFAGCMLLEKPATVSGVRERLRVLLRDVSAPVVCVG